MLSLGFARSSEDSWARAGKVMSISLEMCCAHAIYHTLPTAVNKAFLAPWGVSSCFLALVSGAVILTE